MDLNKVNISFAKTINQRQVNQDIEEKFKELTEDLTKVPDEIFEFTYKIDNVERKFNLRPLLEIDVKELNELTLTNLRVQIERIASIRFTLERAYEQLAEQYSYWKLNYDIWWSTQLSKARDAYWTEQESLMKSHDLAKSAMKSPTQDDLLYTALKNIGISAEYQIKKELEIEFVARIELFKKVDSILGSRGFELKTIIDSRVSRG
jgi:hypothetical protein